MMRSIIHCPTCSAELQATPDLAPGTEVRCPSCATAFPVPDLKPSAPPLSAADPDGIATTPSERPYSRRLTPDTESTVRTDWDERQRGYPEDDEDHPRRFARNYDEQGYGDDGSTGPLPTEYVVEMGRWFEIGKAHFQGRVLLMALYTLLAFIITQIVAQLPYLGALINLFVSPPLFAGLTIVALKQLKGRQWEFGDFFGGFQSQWFLSIVGFEFLTQLAVGLPLLPGIALLLVGVLKKDDTLITAGVGVLVALALVSIYLSVRMRTFGLLLILDRRYRAIEAIRGSWELTQEHFWAIFGVQLLLGLLMVGGLLLCGIGYLFALPFATLVITAGYLLIAGTRPPLDRPRELGEEDYRSPYIR